MKIMSIKKQKNKYKIKLEENITIETYDEVILKYNILYKKEIDENLKEKIEIENKEYDAYNEIAKLINKKLRSENEIRKIMNTKEIKNQEEIIQKLKKSNLINDEFYTKAYIHDKLSFSNYGINKIKNELLNQGIDETTIENELDKVDFEEQNKKLEKLIIKKIKTNTKYSDKIIKQKVISYFMNLGYSKENIEKILNKTKTNDDTIIKKEYDKLVNKYKTKYDEEKLKYIIKQKLYQKGFDIEDINKLIN